MAYFANDEEENVTGVPGTNTTTPGQPGGAVKPGSSSIQQGTSSAPVGTAKQASTAPQQQKFANLNDYINANKTQTTGLANQVGNIITGAGTDARSALNTGVNNYNTDVDKNTVKVDENVFNRAKTDAAGLVGGITNPSAVRPAGNYINTTGFNIPANSRIVSRALAASPNKDLFGNPNSFKPSAQTGGLDLSGNATNGVNNLNDLKTFLKMRDAQYNGPTSLETSQYYQPIQDKLNTAADTTANAQTEAGTGQLVQGIQQKQGVPVSKSANLLNTGLLRGDTNAQSILGNAITSNADLPGAFKTAETNSENRATTAGATTDATRQTIQNAFTGDNSPQAQLQKSLTDKVQTAIGASNDQAQAIVAKLQTNQAPTPEELQQMGVTQGQWDQLQDSIMISNVNGGDGPPTTPDLSQYLNVIDPSVNINAQNIATPADYAKYQALNTLMGTNNTFLNDPTQANTANTNAIGGFDIGSAQAQEDATNKTLDDAHVSEKDKEDLEESVRQKALKKTGPLAKIFKKLKIF